jgi:hypothetical protein
MYAALTRAAERWRGIRVSEFEQRQLTAIRDEIDQDFADRNTPATTAPQSHLSRLRARLLVAHEPPSEAGLIPPCGP